MSRARNRPHGNEKLRYAKWVNKRLPTEAEFEFAARGGLDRNRYAWGNELNPAGKAAANTWQGRFPARDRGEDGYLGTSPVTAFPPNGFGLYDVGGNVWQWCAEWYRPDTMRAERRMERPREILRDQPTASTLRSRELRSASCAVDRISAPISTARSTWSAAAAIRGHQHDFKSRIPAGAIRLAVSRYFAGSP